MNIREEPSRFLRNVLMLDGVVSGVSGVALVAAPGAIASFIGLSSPGAVAVVGASLLVYGAFLVRNARREAPRRQEAAVAVALNVAWVLGSIAIVAAGGLNRQGNWALILVGDVVLAFAALEVMGLRRIAAFTPAEEGRDA